MGTSGPVRFLQNPILLDMPTGNWVSKECMLGNRRLKKYCFHWKKMRSSDWAPWNRTLAVRILCMSCYVCALHHGKTEVWSVMFVLVCSGLRGQRLFIWFTWRLIEAILSQLLAAQKKYVMQLCLLTAKFTYGLLRGEGETEGNPERGKQQKEKRQL